jgi:cytochrome c oxidase cbb3-type subunit 3
MCAACHGSDAKGNQLLGAPNLADKVWLYGGDFDTVRATIAKGRENQMPAHTTLLGDTKVRLLAAYVLSLSQSPEAATQQASTSGAQAEGGGSGSSP